MSHAVFVFPFYNSDAIEKQKPAHFVFNVYINSTFHSHIVAASVGSKEASHWKNKNVLCHIYKIQKVQIDAAMT